MRRVNANFDFGIVSRRAVPSPILGVPPTFAERNQNPYYSRRSKCEACIYIYITREFAPPSPQRYTSVTDIGGGVKNQMINEKFFIESCVKNDRGRGTALIFFFLFRIVISGC